MKSALRIYTLLFCLVLCVCLTPAVFADGESITLPENTTVIQDEAFLNCASMTSVTIPASVTHIGDRAFSGCDNLTFVFYNGTPEQWHKVNIGDGNEALANIICNDDRFPDTYFRAYVYHHFDTDKNAFISDEEISAVTIIDCSGSEAEIN